MLLGELKMKAGKKLQCELVLIVIYPGSPNWQFFCHQSPEKSGFDIYSGAKIRNKSTNPNLRSYFTENLSKDS